MGVRGKFRADRFGERTLHKTCFGFFGDGPDTLAVHSGKRALHSLVHNGQFGETGHSIQRSVRGTDPTRGTAIHLTKVTGGANLIVDFMVRPTKRC
jgi:hypothetical protein